MQDQRWAALAAEIAYDINPTPARPERVVQSVPRGFVEDTTERGIKQLKSAAGEIAYDMTGPFPIGSYVLFTGSQSMAAQPGAVARVLGYGRTAAGRAKIVVQWSDDDLRRSGPLRRGPGFGQMHGGYFLDDQIFEPLQQEQEP